VDSPERLNHERVWIIDPIDGTREFTTGSPDFCVSIGLAVRGEAVLGVVYAPAISQLFWGGKTFGSFRRTEAGTTSITVSAPVESGQTFRVMASKSHLNEATQSFIDRLGAVSLIQAGSSLKFCRVAEGGADIYPRLAPTCEWDTAAAQAVLEGAGGMVLDLDGQPLQYGKPDVLNPSFIATRDRALIPA
jgi:3'(2'), 5'-bisphosphate nucleotidase